MSQGIRGKHVKLYTGSSIGLDSFIYDDSVPGDAISENGHHEGIAITINDTEVVFDNHHPEGSTLNEWITNLQFHGKIFCESSFQIIEEAF